MKDLIAQLQSQVNSVQASVSLKDNEFQNRVADLVRFVSSPYAMNRTHRDEKAAGLEQQKQFISDRHAAEMHAITLQLESSRHAYLAIEVEFKTNLDCL
jgi:hypothetical protein